MSSPIDPERLLDAVGPLLDLNGGIKNIQAANRFINVMLDARKLVHRCVYLNILKSTSDQDIRKEFLFSGGWNILHDWLKEAETSNYLSVIKELLELFLELPLTIDLLKLNAIPKIVRQLSKSNHLNRDVKLLATDLVIIWKDIIAGEAAAQVVDNNVYIRPTAKTNNPLIKLISKNNNHIIVPVKASSSSPAAFEKTMYKSVDPNIDVEENEDSSSFPQAPFAAPGSPANRSNIAATSTQWSSPGNVFEKMKPKEMASFADAISSADVQFIEQKNRPKTAKSYPSKFRSGFDVEPEQPPTKKTKSSTPAIDGISKVLSPVNPASSVAVKRPDSSKIKPTPVAEKKFKASPTTNLLDTLLPPIVITSASAVSSLSDHYQTPSTSTASVTSPTVTTPPPFGKPKGPPQKTVQMIESGSFMAALEGNAAQKASLVRKKKVLPKQLSTGSLTATTTTTVTSATVAPTASVSSMSVAKQPQFYKEIVKVPPTSVVERLPQSSTGPQSKDGKKRVRWAVDSELVQIQYFEIDETERINVNRIKTGGTWGDLKHFEMHREREFMEAARKQRYREPQTEEVYFPWKLIPFDGMKDMMEVGLQSDEKKIQAERQKNILAEVYLPGMPLPDSPKEPEFTDRTAQQEPVIIPLEDTSSSTTAQLPPELNKLLEGLKQSGMIANPNMMGPSNVMNMPLGMMPNPVMQPNMNRPPNMPAMMPPPFGPPSMMPMPYPPASGPPPPMHNGSNNGAPSGGHFSQPRNSGPPPGYGPNMNLPPRNWGPSINGPPQSRRPGPPHPHMRAGPPRGPTPYGQNFRQSFRGGRPPMQQQAQTAPVRKFNKVCPFFQQDRCTFGDQCRYLHIKEKDEQHESSAEVKRSPNDESKLSPH